MRLQGSKRRRSLFLCAIRRRRHGPPSVFSHDSIQRVTLDGKLWTQIQPRLEAIELPQQQGPYRLESGTAE
jgi:hypothetical protein